LEVESLRNKRPQILISCNRTHTEAKPSDMTTGACWDLSAQQEKGQGRAESDQCRVLGGTRAVGKMVSLVQKAGLSETAGLLTGPPDLESHCKLGRNSRCIRDVDS
jgi:hypothetical protein